MKNEVEEALSATREMVRSTSDPVPGSDRANHHAHLVLAIEHLKTAALQNGELVGEVRRLGIISECWPVGSLQTSDLENAQLQVAKIVGFVPIIDPPKPEPPALQNVRDLHLDTVLNRLAFIILGFTIALVVIALFVGLP